MSANLSLWIESTWNDQLALRLRVDRCCYHTQSPFQRIEIYESQALGKVLRLGDNIVQCEADEAIYSEGLTHPALQCLPQARSVLVLGGGDGGVTREVTRYAQLERIVVVEIDQLVVDACRTHCPQWTQGFDDARVELIIDDAHRYLANGDEHFDIIIVDADHLHDPSSNMVHRMAFTDALKRRLAEGGIVIAPLGIPALDGESCRCSLAQMRDRFACCKVYQITGPSVLGHRWTIAWCSDDATPIPDQTVAQKFVDQLQFWSPELQAALFCLPRHIAKALGILRR